MPRYQASRMEEEEEDWILDILPGDIQAGEQTEPLQLLDRWGNPIEPTTHPIGFTR